MTTPANRPPRSRSLIPNRALWWKSFRDGRVLLLGGAVVMFAYSWLRVWIVGLIPMHGFETMLDQIPMIERFLDVPLEQMFTYPGRVSLTFHELIVVMCMSVWAISRGSDVVSGELSRGTMEMLLAQPVSRLQILISHAITTLLGVIVLAGSCWLGILAGIHFTTVEQGIPSLGPIPLELLADGATIRVPLSSKASSSTFLTATSNLMALGVFLAGLSTLMSSWDRYRWRTIGIVSGIFTVQLIIKIAGMATETLNWMLPYSFFSAYVPDRIVSITVNTPEYAWHLGVWNEQGQWQGMSTLGYDLMLIGIGAGCYLIAGWIFCRRDLPAPI